MIMESCSLDQVGNMQRDLLQKEGIHIPRLFLKVHGGLPTAFIEFNQDAIYRIEFCGHIDDIGNWVTKWQNHAYNSGMEIIIESDVLL